MGWWLYEDFFLCKCYDLCPFFLVAEAHIIKYGEVRCPEFELRSLYKLYNIPTNWVKFTETTYALLPNLFVWITMTRYESGHYANHILINEVYMYIFCAWVNSQPY